MKAMEVVDFGEVFDKITTNKGFKDCPEVMSYIDGRWQGGEGELLIINDPASGKLFGTLRDCDVDQIKNACRVAKPSQKYWHFEVGEQEKKAVFERFIDYLRTFRTQLAVIRCKESGRTIRMCDADVQELIDTFDHYHGEIPKAGSGLFEFCQMTDKFGITSQTPYGRGLDICPWNFLAIWGWGVAAELAGGNAAIVKISSETPFAASCLTELFHQSIREVLGYECWQKLKGLVQQIHGRGSTTGDSLVTCGDYEHISFTGGKEVGRKIASIAGSRLILPELELGGHNAVAVMSDYPIDRAVQEVIIANMFDAGERCVSARVAFVEESLFDEFVNKYMVAVKALRIGHPMKVETELNPLVSWKQMAAVNDFVERAEKAGIKPLIGGYPLATPADVVIARQEGFNIDSEFAVGGYFYLPTVFVDVPMNAELMVEECFGPVLCINRFSSGKDKIEALDNVIELINQSDYGLSNSILTHDLTLAMRAIPRVETGIEYIGRGTTGAEVGKYFGGVKNSGFGRKGRGIECTTYIKQVYIDFASEARMAQVGAESELEECYGGAEWLKW